MFLPSGLYVGQGLVDEYSGSLGGLLRATYPEHEWHQWKFKQVPKGYWEVAVNRRAFLDYVGKALGVRKLEDWYNIRRQQLAENGMPFKFSKSHSLLVFFSHAHSPSL
jgi:hypothetical protein